MSTQENIHNVIVYILKTTETENSKKYAFATKVYKLTDWWYFNHIRTGQNRYHLQDAYPDCVIDPYVDVSVELAELFTLIRDKRIKRILTLLLSGYNQVQIAKKMKVSKQRVNQLVLKIREAIAKVV